MRKTDAVLLSLIAATVAFAAVYLYNPPGPRYVPVLHLWSWDPPAGEASMGWYSRLLFAAAAALLTGLLVKVLIKTRPEVLAGNGLIRLASVVALSALVLSAAWILWHELSHALWSTS